LEPGCRFCAHLCGGILHIPQMVMTVGGCRMNASVDAPVARTVRHRRDIALCQICFDWFDLVDLAKQRRSVPWRRLAQDRVNHGNKGQAVSWAML
jgi:hypothetical protein